MGSRTLAELKTLKTTSEIEAQKAFISRQEDRVRLAYDKRMSSFPRQCVFMGTSNEREYLRADENRRMWPIRVIGFTQENPIDTDRLFENKDQLWAEAMEMYRTLCQRYDYRSLNLSLRGEAAREARLRQDEVRMQTIEDQYAPQIAEWMDRKIPLSEITDGSAGFSNLDDPDVVRTKICVAQLMAELFSGGRRDPGLATAGNRVLARSLDLMPGWRRHNHSLRYETYGRQRSWVREGVTGREIELGYTILEPDDDMEVL